MGSGDLIASPLGDQGGFNWVFLIELLLSGILSVFFLFYFNRVFATLVSYAIRFYTWRKYKAYIDITSLQLSLLGGRLFFKSLRYQAHNETILIHDGRITWRYWLRSVQVADVYRTSPDSSESDGMSESETPSGSEDPEKRDGVKVENAKVEPQVLLPCRMHIRVSGVEAFLYNHSPSYDHILSEFEAAKVKRSSQHSTSKPDSEASPDAGSGSVSKDTKGYEKASAPDVDRVEESRNAYLKRTERRYPLPVYLKLFPIQVECKKAAAVVGNENTTTVVVAKTQAARGRIDASQAGPLDFFKLLFDLEGDNVSIQLRQNQDFKETQLAAATHPDRFRDKRNPKRPFWASFSRPVSLLMRRLRRMFTWTQSSSASVRATSGRNHSTQSEAAEPLVTLEPWHGLARFLDTQDGGPMNEWEHVEYARLSTLAEVDKLSLKFFWDIAGTVGANDDDITGLPRLIDDANGSTPPDYGLELTLGNGYINYGPWTDRERIVLQAVFFPASMVDARPLQPLQVGETRLSTVFNMTFIVDGAITVRVPTREPSKDWRHQSSQQSSELGKTTTGLRQRGQNSRPKSKARPDAVVKDKRTFGWMDVTVGSDTVVHYKMDMYARKHGYRNCLRVDVKKPCITTSINHDTLWKSGDVTIEGDLSNPLSWNALRTWTFKIGCDDLDLYILRDHMFLLTDLISDWTSGSSSSFHTFVPYCYKLEADFRNFNLILASNDANLISRPTDPDDNTFLTLRGEALHVDFTIPLEFYQPPTSTFVFDVAAQNLTLDLLNPPRFTLHELLQPKQVARLPQLTLKGRMMTHADQSPELTDILQMEVCGTDLDLIVHGFILRYFVNFKNNYFGEFLHFRTMEEYQATNRDTSVAVEEELKKYRFRQSNDLDVILSIIVERPVLKLPANLYTSDSFVKVELPTAEVDLRVTNYYLDLQVDVSPASFTYVVGDGSDDPPVSEEQLRIESVAVTGHRLFGLPPAEPAYVSTWDINAGKIYGRCSTEFIHQMTKAGQSLMFALADDENALPDTGTVNVDDMIFLQLRTEAVKVAVDIGDVVVSVSFDPVSLRFDDAAGNLFSSRLTTRIPNLTVDCLSSGSTNRHNHHGEVNSGSRQLCFLQTTVDLSLVTRKKDFQQQRLAQQKHLIRQDIRTGRARFLFDERMAAMSMDSEDLLVDEPAMPFPGLPWPKKNSAKPPSVFKMKASNVHRGLSEPSSRSDDFGLPHTTLLSPYLGPPMSNLPNAGDRAEIPNFLPHDLHDNPYRHSPVDTESQGAFAAHGEAQLTLLVSLAPGIRALMRPELLEITSQVTDAFVPTTDADMMDSIHQSVLKMVQDATATKKGHVTSFNLQIDIPTFSLRTVIETRNQSQQHWSKHHLDLTFHHLLTSLRMRDTFDDLGPRRAVVLHSTLESISLELFTNIDSRNPTLPDIHFDLEEVLVWANLAEIMVLDVSFKVLATSISAYELRDTTLAIIDITEKAVSMYTVVSRLDETYYIRMRQLLRYISQHHDGGPDPPYILRMTQALRAFPEHLRNQESWKMLARIRHVHTKLSKEQRGELNAITSKSPDNRTRRNSIPMHDLLSWCAWDIPAPQETAIYRYVLGEPDAVVDVVQKQWLQLTVRSGLIRLQIGPSTRGSEFSVADLSVEVEVKPPSEPTGLMLVEDNIRTLVSTVAHSSAIFLRLKWDLVNSISPILDAIELSPSLTEKVESLASLSRFNSVDGSATRDDFHFLFSTDDGTMMIDTINLQHISAVREFRVSVMGTSRIARKYADCMCLLINADQATTELHSHGVNRQKIWRTTLGKPTIYLDSRKRLESNVKELNVGATYEEMAIAIEQEPIAVMAALERILMDEAVQIRDIQDRVSAILGEASTEQAPDSNSTEVLEINAALLAGAFNVNIALLQSLVMNIRGKVANLRVKPKGHDYSKLDIEVEVGPVRYAALSKESGLVGEDALFHTPSAGTSIEVDQSKPGGHLKIFSTVQEMQIEASAVQNILNVFKRSEVKEALDALGNGVSSIQVRTADLLGRKKVRKPASSSPEKPPLQYSIDLTLAGFQVKARAPAHEAGIHSAELIFGLGLVQCAVNNEAEDGEPKFPEISARVSNIYATLNLIGNQKRSQCGHVRVGLMLQTKESTEAGKSRLGDVLIMSDSLDVEVSAATASTMVDIITHVQKKMVDLDLSKEVDYLKRLRPIQRHSVVQKVQVDMGQSETTFDTITSLAPSNLMISLTHIRFAWVVSQPAERKSDWVAEDLEFSLARVEFSIKQRNKAQLKIDSLLLQMVPKNADRSVRNRNSALLPEMVFAVKFGTRNDGLQLAFQAVGQALDVTLDSDFVGPLGLLVSSIDVALEKYHAASKNWQTNAPTESSDGTVREKPFGRLSLASLLMDLSFAGVVIHLEGKTAALGFTEDERKVKPMLQMQNTKEKPVKAEFTAPGFAMKLQYLSDEKRKAESSLTGEIKINASSNTVYPDLVPIIIQISESVKSAMQTAEASEKHEREAATAKRQSQRNTMISLPDENMLTSNELLAKTQISIGVRIESQEFGLSCQPFAKVNATAKFDEIYISFNTVDATPNDRFLAVSSTLTNLKASVQHIYSRESSFSFDMKSVSLSVMNSKNKQDNVSGISAIVKVDPMRTMLNARQLQDLLLFREIWLPEQIRGPADAPPQPSPTAQTDDFLVEKYRQVATATAFPWNVTVSLDSIELDIDFGQSIGRSTIKIGQAWATSAKTSGWKQDLCIGIGDIDAQSVGRMGGFIDLKNLRLRTLIEWPLGHDTVQKTPTIQATVEFDQLKVKAAFDHQPFAFAELATLAFIMFNVRDNNSQFTDRLVATMYLKTTYVYCTATSPAQAFGLYQAFDRLIQEKQAAFQQSIADLQKQLKRPSLSSSQTMQRLHPMLVAETVKSDTASTAEKTRKLRVDVMMRLASINLGVYPGTFFDGQILKLEATDGLARFLSDIEDGQTHSNLGMVLGQLQVALAPTKRVALPKSLGDIPIDEVIQNGSAAKGGIILRVPRLVATMQTWQPPEERIIDFIFKSTFEGKVDVGWNLSRISFIRTMWATHTKSLAAKLGKPLPESAVRITAGLDQKDIDKADGGEDEDSQDQGKITAVVNMPLSRYEYRALEPPVIETPQLRDMGEATPPLEWIGLQREKLPHVVHQVIIVTLLELAKEVEDAYGRILGSS